MGNDELWRWWRARSKARITAVHFEDRRISFAARCEYRAGFVVKVPLGGPGTVRCTVDGKRARCRIERRYGRGWALIPLPRGKHDAAVEVRGRR